MAELRKDLITGEWVNIVVERAKRPSDFHHRAIKELRLNLGRATTKRL